MPLNLPALTHLHFLVLTLIRRGEVSSSQLRAGLALHGVTKSTAAFYELMDRMTAAGWLTSKVLSGGPARREYSVTKLGVSALQDAARFYGQEGNERRAA